MNIQYSTGIVSDLTPRSNAYHFVLTENDGSEDPIRFYHRGPVVPSWMKNGEEVRVGWDPAVVPPLGGPREALDVNLADRLA